MLGSVLLRTQLQSWRSGNEEQFAVGQDAINVEKYEFDFFGAKFGGLRFGHPGDSSIGTDVIRLPSLLEGARSVSLMNFQLSASLLGCPRDRSAKGVHSFRLRSLRLALFAFEVRIFLLD